MKRFIAAILCVGLIAAISTGCAYKDALSKDNTATTRATEATGNVATVDEIDAKNFSDNLQGLSEYFAKKEYITTKDGKIDESTVTVMDASLIGAKEGKKYATAYGGKAITIELYEYDVRNLNNLNDTAKTVIESVKNSGEFTILDLPPVKAYLSNNGRYIMVYTDSSIDDANPDKESDNYKHREEVIKNFKSFI